MPLTTGPVVSITRLLVITTGLGGVVVIVWPNWSMAVAVML